MYKYAIKQVKIAFLCKKEKCIKSHHCEDPARQKYRKQRRVKVIKNCE